MRRRGIQGLRGTGVRPSELLGESKEKVMENASGEIAANKWSCWYLSWADAKGWLGGAFITGYGPITARLRARAFGINPGGECLLIELPIEAAPAMEWRNRLLNREEMLIVDPESTSIGEMEKRGQKW
jgi:hypothetical protein